MDRCLYPVIPYPFLVDVFFAALNMRDFAYYMGRTDMDTSYADGKPLPPSGLITQAFDAFVRKSCHCVCGYNRRHVRRIHFPL